MNQECYEYHYVSNPFLCSIIYDGMMWWMEAGRWIWNTVYILCIVHVHDVVTDWSYALV